MFRKSRFFPVGLEVVMTPTIRAVQTARDQSHREGIEGALRKVGRGEDVYGLKEYRGRPDERHSLEGDCQAGPVNGSGI